MAEEEDPLTGEPAPPPGPARRNWRRYIVTRGAALLVGLVGLLFAAVLLLDSQIGHRFVIDRIAELSPRSGLKIQVGRIEGSIFDEAVLHDVVLRDPEGVFMTVPEAELRWRPLSWMRSGLDIRKLVLHRGFLARAPRLRPGDPNAPLLPQFDIRVDRFELDRLTVGEKVFGQRRRINLVSKADIRKGRLLLDVNSALGGGDRLFARVDAEPDRDRFDLLASYDAPRGGLLAGLAGAKSEIRAIAFGKGKWSDWHGVVAVRQDGKRFAAFQLGNKAGRYSALGQVYPDGLLKGVSRTAIGRALSLRFDGTFQDSVLDGRVWSAADTFKANAGGRIDFARNAFDQLVTKIAVRRPELVLADPALSGVTLEGTVDGPFRNFTFAHEVRVAELRSGTIVAEGLNSAGTARYDGRRILLPLDITARRVVTGYREIDPRLAGGTLRGDLVLEGSRLSSDNIAVNLRGLMARLALRGDLAKGGYAVAGPVTLRGFALPNIGLADADAKILASIGAGAPWKVALNASGRMTRVDNATLASIAGGNIRFAGGINLARNAPILFRDGRLTASKLSLRVSGRRLADGRTTFSGGGRHVDYGPFTVEADVGAAGPKAVLVFASPYPAAGLSDVRVALAPIKDGFRIDTAGGSALGPFDGVINLFSAPGGPTRLAIERLKVWETNVTGDVLLGKAGVSGNLALNGGGLDGTLRIDPQGEGQRIEALVFANDARFGGPTPLSIGRGRLEATGFLAKGRTTLDATVTGEGIASGRLFIGRLAANAKLENGAGTVAASVTGSRGSRFALSGTGQVSPNRVVVLASGEFAGRRITMPRRAVLTREDGGWRLSPTQVGFGGGYLIASGHVLGGGTELELKMAQMPLSLGDIVVSDLGLGGTASGIVNYSAGNGQLPTGDAALMVKGLTRSGLVLSSKPIDLALVARLAPATFQTRAVIKEGGETRGRLQARIAGMPSDGDLATRLRRGRLLAQLRYAGPADALWRLVALETFDLTGPVTLAADVTGTLDSPVVRGSVASDNLRVQSGLSGTDLRQVRARGTFDGSRLQLSTVQGTTKGGGSVVAAGTIDLSNLGTRRPGIDLRIAARDALLIDRDDMAATATGPIRIVSDGSGGTIAGRLTLDKARWQLGRASSPAELPVIRTREINQRADVAPPRAVASPWRYLIDARAANQVNVRGLGLDSEWSTDVRLRGTTSAPTITGQADLIRGGYEFAGKRFELTRGRIRFFGQSPPDPQLDIAAEADVDNLQARIAIGGSASKPIITFSSSPALPEEEVLSRLLFGSSITNISAVEALQLGAAVASLRGGNGGLDPINKLRSAIGLDRLRIVGADPVLGRGTSIAVGKYLGRRFFVELVTDGQGYSATSIEFRITRWLALLATVSTVGDQSINLKASKDY